MPPHLDVLIAGQGLAGSLLAYQLIGLGLRAHVVDPGNAATASRAAAGLLSPYAGARYQAPERLDALLAECHHTYAMLEKALVAPVFQPSPIWRLLQSPHEEERIAHRRQHAPGRERLGPVTLGELPHGVRAPWGGVCMHGGGQVHLDTLLAAVGQWLRARKCLETGFIAPGAVTLGRNRGVRWQDRRADCVIFCDGAGAFTNPWWRALPWRHSRGETLDIEPLSGAEWPRTAITGSKSLVPLAGGRYRLGATYERGTTAGSPSAKARNELLAALPTLLAGRTQVRVLGGRAGMRPGSRPGPPFLGLHPSDARIGILNGFGSRGTLLAPLYAKRLAEHLASARPLPPEADVHRYIGTRDP
ncbi:FAD-binding oxidoreductase [Aquisalimonas sp.]|uniref:NAD(P)/FAD-dependent oxidoreductase n=1 Tax=Aquisalimonas sp. TaxID=1872621 RepID=UPI0025BC83FE|nr:FAD-binding oxidoreductase [Aquisalimonas sp.]